MSGLSAPRVVYGVHSATFYNTKTGIRYGTMRVLGNGTFSMTGNTVDLRGGSNRFPWSVQDGNIDAKIDLNTKEYPDFMFEVLMGKKPTLIAADASGDVNSFANVKGSSIKDATNGISVAIPLAGSEANLKFGKYLLVAVDATHVDVYGSSNIDFNRGVDVDFIDDSLKLNAAPLLINVGANSIASLGLTFTGIGAPAFIVGDTASFEVLPITTDNSMEVVIGGLSDIFPEFGVVLMAQQLGSEEMFEIDVFKCKAIGANLGAQEKAYSETPISAKAFYDSVKKGVCKIRAVKP